MFSRIAMDRRWTATMKAVQVLTYSCFSSALRRFRTHWGGGLLFFVVQILVKDDVDRHSMGSSKRFNALKRIFLNDGAARGDDTISLDRFLQTEMALIVVVRVS
jgi:hypothetical protein